MNKLYVIYTKMNYPLAGYFCEAIADDGTVVCRFEAEDPDNLAATLTADPERENAIVDRFPKGFETVILGEGEEVPDEVWAKCVALAYDPSTWDDNFRAVWTEYFGEIEGDPFFDQFTQVPQ